MPFLPMFPEEISEPLDFIFVCGDAYIDHPSFGMSIITRTLENAGYSVGVIAQPNWQDAKDIKRLGKPNLAFLVSAGNIDSMVAHYTAAKKKRSTDAYSPAGKAGKRPDRAIITYCNLIREAHGNIPIVIGGLEASLRRFAHYDYWSDKVRRSILFDSRADLLVYGMGETAILEIASQLKTGAPINEITDILGTCYISHTPTKPALPSYESVRDSKSEYAKATAMLHSYDKKSNPHGSFSQAHGNRYLICNPPQPALSRKQLDSTYALPYMRAYHPSYESQGGIPAINEVEFSLTSSRGCFGSCNFCSLSHHQGSAVTSRSHASLVSEATQLIQSPRFKGYIHDVGGPTANFRSPSCEKPCNSTKRCLFPTPCKHLKAQHHEYLELLRKLRTLPKVKKVFIRSGIRYDYLLHDKNANFFKELVTHHVSGQLKVAPEHSSPNVLQKMGKPSFDVYRKFSKKFFEYSKLAGKEQYLVPYLMSSHPGSTLHDAIALAEYLIDNRINPEQVQDFYPTPGTISTTMYHTGIDPRDMSEVYVPKSFHEKTLQRALLQPKNPANRKLVREALVKAERLDLIPKFLGGKNNGNNSGRKKTSNKNKARAKNRGNAQGSKTNSRRGNRRR